MLRRLQIPLRIMKLIGTIEAFDKDIKDDTVDVENDILNTL